MNILTWLLLVGFTLANPVVELMVESMRNPDHIIPVSNANLSLVSGPREYWTLITFTSTDDKHGCTICHDLPKIVGTILQSWWSDYANSGFHLFFLDVDIVDRSNIPLFDKLQFTTIPHVWLIPPNRSINPADEDSPGYEDIILTDPHFVFEIPVASLKEQTFEFARFLTETMQKSITVRSEDPTTKFVKTFLGTFLLIVLIKKKGPESLKNINKKYMAALFFIGLTLAFICGSAFTTTNAVPFLARNDKGELIYISGGIYYQFGVEIPIVATNYTLLAASLVSLIWLGAYKVGPENFIKTEGSRFVWVIANSIVLYLLYSTLTSIFLRKDHDYPFGFTKLF